VTDQFINRSNLFIHLILQEYIWYCWLLLI